VLPAQLPAWLALGCERPMMAGKRAGASAGGKLRTEGGKKGTGTDRPDRRPVPFFEFTAPIIQEWEESDAAAFLGMPLELARPKPFFAW
jgi:hypothetical protein